MRRLLVAIPLALAACGHQPELTAEQQWNYMSEDCHKVLIATGPVSVAPKDWKPANSKKLIRYRSQLTDASKDYVARTCGVYPGTSKQQS